MQSFALYRQPLASQCTMVRSMSKPPGVLSSSEEISDCRGFVIAPFAVSPSSPIAVIVTDECHTFDHPAYMPSSLKSSLDGAARANARRRADAPSRRQHYSEDFRRFHSRLVQGEFSKLVLARCCLIEGAVESPTELFVEACRLYPRCFVSLFSTPLTGTWIVATPELLISREGDEYRTMALAGTMEYLSDDDPIWSDKNVREQRYVASYISDAIAPLSQTLSATEPHTVRAAHLVHLRTDFRFTLAGARGIGEIVSALHPTPAVCGIPKTRALDFILENEHTPRTYYSGYCGPVGVEGSTCLYVSLRCMQILSSECCLYAGGGLLPDSTEAAEWNETEAKMLTMKRLL